MLPDLETIRAVLDVVIPIFSVFALLWVAMFVRLPKDKGDNN